jgi:phosphoribosylglycinamide formyltransferase 2
LWQPHLLSEPALDAARSIAARIAGKLGGTGLFTVDLLLGTDPESGAEEVYYATVHPMLTGAGFVTTRSQRLSQFDLHARAILGLPVDTIMISPAAGEVSRPSSDKAALARALPDALAIAESDVRLSGEVCVALATAPDVVRARDRAHQVGAVLGQAAAINQTGK